jgi:hypothetical protein
MFILFLLVEVGYEKEGCFMAQDCHPSPGNTCMHFSAGDSVLILRGDCTSRIHYTYRGIPIAVTGSFALLQTLKLIN